MDATDAVLANSLAQDGRTTFSDLAEQVGLSAPSTAERVRRLEVRGVIRGYHADVDPAECSRGLTAFVAVSLGSPAARASFLMWAEGEPDVLECHHVAGDDDYLLKVVADGTRGLEELVTLGIKGLDGVARTRTTVVLSSAFDRGYVPPAEPEPAG